MTLKLQANLFSTINGKENLNGGGIILSGHTDVVPTITKRMVIKPLCCKRKRQQNLWAGDRSDMKGFIACTLAMAPFFASQKLKKPIHFAYTYDEETSCLGAPVMLK